MTMVSEVLRKAATYKFTQCEAARYEDGRPCDPLDISAAMFDPHGAITRAAWELGYTFRQSMLVRDELEAFLDCSLKFWSELPHRTQESIIRAMIQCASHVEACAELDKIDLSKFAETQAMLARVLAKDKKSNAA